jgi:hypothetical protein
MPRPRALPTARATFKIDERSKACIDHHAAQRRIDKSAAVRELVQSATFDRVTLRVGQSVTLARADGAIEFRIALPGASRGWLAGLERFAARVKDSLAKHGGLYEVK